MPTNDGVSWNGTRFGFVPSVTPEVELAGFDGMAAVPVLLEALEDPERFVTAHVLLTRISGVEHELFPTWNGLQVSLAADGQAEVDPAQRQELARRWRKWAGESPAPDALPPADES